MDVRSLLPERVALLQGLVIVRSLRHSHACAQSIAGSQKGAKVRAVRDPQRGDDQTTPARMLLGAANPAKFDGLGLGPAHAAGVVAPERLIYLPAHVDVVRTREGNYTYCRNRACTHARFLATSHKYCVGVAG